MTQLEQPEPNLRRALKMIKTMDDQRNCATWRLTMKKGFLIDGKKHLRTKNNELALKENGGRRGSNSISSSLAVAAAYAESSGRGRDCSSSNFLDGNRRKARMHTSKKDSSTRAHKSGSIKRGFLLESSKVSDTQKEQTHRCPRVQIQGWTNKTDLYLVD